MTAGSYARGSLRQAPTVLGRRRGDTATGSLLTCRLAATTGLRHVTELLVNAELAEALRPAPVGSSCALCNLPRVWLLGPTNRGVGLDLEKFEEVVVGRELKMIALEKELESLRKEGDRLRAGRI